MRSPKLRPCIGQDDLLRGHPTHVNTGVIDSAVEPGVYLPGEFGVRIEDLVIARQDGPEILTEIGKQLTVVD